jgi:hypothetical protein
VHALQSDAGVRELREEETWPRRKSELSVLGACGIVRLIFFYFLGGSPPKTNQCYSTM